VLTQVSASCCMRYHRLRRAAMGTPTHDIRGWANAASAGGSHLSANIDDIVLERATVAQRTVPISGGQQLLPCRLHL